MRTIAVADVLELLRCCEASLAARTTVASECGFTVRSATTPFFGDLLAPPSVHNDALTVALSSATGTQGSNKEQRNAYNVTSQQSIITWDKPLLAGKRNLCCCPQE
jgi:hypothetical protein